MIRRLFVSLTFDDGFLSHVMLAKELAKHGIYSTFFVTPYFKGRNFLSNKLESLKIISRLGHEVGSHGLSHRPLVALTPSDAEYEIKASKAILEDIIGRKVYGFAYPFDFFNNQVIAIVMRHYDYARRGFDPYDILNISVLNNKNKNNYSITRYLINSINPLLSIRRIMRILELRISYYGHRHVPYDDTGWLVLTFHNEPMNKVLSFISLIKQVSNLLDIKVEFRPVCSILFNECLE
ncbi:MAG: polysaccharide deacetylase family protein [Vulcanisaeta sp.]